MTDTIAAWDARIARARALAETHDAAAGLLSFYANLAEQQREFATGWISAADATIAPSSNTVEEPADASDADVEANAAATLLTARHGRLALDVVPTLLGWLRCEAPSGIGEATALLARLNDEDWHSALDGYLRGAGGDRDPDLAPVRFVLETILQPLAAIAADATPIPTSVPSSSRCPHCNSLPVVGVLREEGPAAKRHLVCGTCLHEWPSERLACASCGEQDPEKLPVFTAEQWPIAHMEACDSCRTYIKTLDATKERLIVPVVDDLATVALDLWAREQRYLRLRPSLLGT